MRLYKLDENRKPVLTDSYDDFMKAFSTQDRQIALDTVGKFSISTVFMGWDHQCIEDGPPIIYETMMFDNRKSIACKRASTEKEALEYHNQQYDYALELTEQANQGKE